MKEFKQFRHIKENSKEEIETLYEMLGLSKKNKDMEDIDRNLVAKISELLAWNAEIEVLEEGEESGHTLRIACLAKKIAEKLDLSEQEIKSIYLAALFHDVGKHLLPKEIIGKPGPLTEEEYAVVKTHCDLAEVLIKVVVSKDVIDMIKNHHERLDGSGYPRGIIPESIGSRIIGLVDTYEAMTSDKIYSISKSKHVTFQELERCTLPKEQGGFGELYDIRLVEILKDIES